jgi:hypothetical protein
VHFGNPPERCRAIVADFHKQKHCAAPVSLGLSPILVRLKYLLDLGMT